MRQLAVTTIAASVLLPVFAFAETSTSTIATLLEQIKTLQAKIVELQKQQQTLVNTQRENVATLLKTLKEGASGDDVKILQALLAADLDIYPEGVISGFYGRLTALAVKRFQKKHGIDQAGRVGELR